MTTPRPHAELAARQSVTDEPRLAAKSAAPYVTAMIGASHLSDAADTIDNLRAQLAEAQAALKTVMRGLRCNDELALPRRQGDGSQSSALPRRINRHRLPLLQYQARKYGGRQLSRYARRSQAVPVMRSG